MSSNNYQSVHGGDSGNHLFNPEFEKPLQNDNAQERHSKAPAKAMIFPVLQQKKETAWDIDSEFNNQHLQKSQQAPSKNHQAIYVSEFKEPFLDFDVGKLMRNNGDIEGFIDRLILNEKALIKECNDWKIKFEELEQKYNQICQQTDSEVRKIQDEINVTIENLKKKLAEQVKKKDLFDEEIRRLKDSKDKVDALKKDAEKEHTDIACGVEKYKRDAAFYNKEHSEIKEKANADKKKFKSLIRAAEKELEDLKAEKKREIQTSNAGIQTDAIVETGRMSEQIDQTEESETSSTSGLISQTFEPEGSDLNFQYHAYQQPSTSASRPVPRMSCRSATNNNSPSMRPKQPHNSIRHKKNDAPKVRKVKVEDDSYNKAFYSSSEGSDEEHYDHGAIVPVEEVKRENENSQLAERSKD